MYKSLAKDRTINKKNMEEKYVRKYARELIKGSLTGFVEFCQCYLKDSKKGDKEKIITYLRHLNKIYFKTDEYDYPSVLNRNSVFWKDKLDIYKVYWYAGRCTSLKGKKSGVCLVC